MPATEGIARRWDGIASGPEIGLSGYCRVWVDDGGNAYYVHGKECAIIDPEGMVY